MTKDEAITAVKEVTGMSLPWDDRHYEALQMAIEALNHLADPGKKVSSSCGQENDMVYRQAAIDALAKAMPSLTTPDGSGEFDHDIQITDEAFVDCMQIINELPSAQPEKRTIKRTETHACDLISRQKVRYKLTALVNELEEIFAHIRERNEDDSVCGLCEYDGAYIGQSGDWCNECPGFDKSDCFKLKDKYRHEWETIDE